MVIDKKKKIRNQRTVNIHMVNMGNDALQTTPELFVCTGGIKTVQRLWGTRFCGFC